VPGICPFSSATKWLAQAILPDAIKMGVGTACDEKPSSSHCNEVNIIVGIYNSLYPSMLQQYINESTPGCTKLNRQIGITSHFV
jgi:hypothetical protein